MIPTFSFRPMLAAIRQQPLYRHPSAYLWQNCLSINNQFCEAVVNAGYLTWEQMVNAACRYCLGATKHGGVIFWQIDHEGRVHDGKVMYYLPDCHRNKSKAAHPTWVSSLLVRREKVASRQNTTSHCFFGQHLLGHTEFIGHTDITEITDYMNVTQKEQKSQKYFVHTKSVCEKGCALSNHKLQNSNIKLQTSKFKLQRNKPVVCVVEAEKSAFILSELYPDNIWLAAGGLGEVQPDKFRALRGRKVILFPDTDPDGIAFQRWTEAANQVMQASFWEESPPIRVSSILEEHATEEQKERKVDLVDYLFEHNAVKLLE